MHLKLFRVGAALSSCGKAITIVIVMTIVMTAAALLPTTVSVTVLSA